MSIRVLFVSYIYLPVQSGGTQRICQFFNALAESDLHDVDLVTTNAGNEIPRAGVHCAWDPLASYRQRRSHRQSGSSTTQSSDTLRLVRRLLFLALCFPDEFMAFIPFATLRGLRLAKPRPDYILSTFPPASNLVVGATLAHLLRSKHIVDLREPWLDKPDWTLKYRRDRLCSVRLRCENRLERWILRSAHRVIVNHQWMASSYSDLVGDATKMVTITNGYDDADFADLARVGSEHLQSVSIVYAGSYYQSHQPDSLLRALAVVVERNKALASRFRFHVYGSIDDRTRSLFRSYSQVLPIYYHGYIPRRELLVQLNRANLAVASFPATAWSSDMIPGKVYEYLRLGLPMLILGREGSALQRFAKWLNEPFFGARNTEAIADFLVRFASSPGLRVRRTRDDALLRQFEYSHLREEFLGLFR